MVKCKKWMAVMMAAVCTVSLAGCGGGKTADKGQEGAQTQQAGAQKNDAQKTDGQNSDTRKTEAPAAAEGKVTVSYWTTNRHDQEYMTKKIEEFNNTNDAIYIDYQVYADNYSQMLDLAFSTDTAPDVFQIIDFPLYHEKGYMLDLAPYMDEEYKARFGDGAFVEGINSYGDAIYSMPYTASAARLFYNKDIFERVGIEAPPKTLDEMVADAKLITEQLGKEGIYGFAGNFKSAASSINRTVDVIVQRSGGTRGGYDYQAGKYDFTSYKPVLEAFQAILAGGAGFPGSESLDIDPLRTQFAAGNIGMYMSVSHAEPGVYTSQFPTDVNWDCAQIPTVSGNVDGKQNLWFGGNYAAINTGTAHPDEAWEVMKFLYSDEVMGEYYSLGLGTVMIPSAIKDVTPPATIEKMPNLAINDDDKNWPPLPINVVVEGKDYTALSVECIFGMADIDKTIEDLNKRYNEAYEKSIANGEERVIYPNFDPLNQNTSK